MNQLIIHEKDAGRLIRQACDLLVESRGYGHALIDLLNDDVPLLASRSRNYDDTLMEAFERHIKSETPPCVQKALAQPGIVPVSPSSECPRCPLEQLIGNKGCMITRIEHAGKVYGFLNVSLPIRLRDVLEEQSLFMEVAGDIAFALHTIERKQKRKAAEVTLQESEERYRSLIDDVLDSSSVGIFILDADFKVAWINHALEHYFGLRRETVIGQDKRQLIREQIKVIFEDPDGYTEKVFATYDNNTYIENFTCHVLPGGERKERWLEHWSQPVRSGLYAGGRIEHYYDITDRKQAEKELIASENKYRTLVENLSQKIFFKDRNSIYVSCNENYARDLKIKPEEIIGRTDYEFFQKDLAEKYRADDIRVMESGRTEELEDKYIQDGYEMFVQTVKTPVKDEKGNIKGILGIFWDITERKRAEEEVRQSLAKLRKAMGGIIKASARMVETRDPYTAGHQKRVADLARSIAQEMSLPGNTVDGIRTAAVIHDLGKIAIPSEILSKPTNLSKKEFDLIKTHPQVGYDILKDIDFPWPIARIVFEHHERIDGSGYPNGLTGEKLLIESRILAVADVIEAMASHRPYRPAPGIDKALEEISRNSGILYDPHVVNVCLKLFREKEFSFEQERIL